MSNFIYLQLPLVRALNLVLRGLLLFLLDQTRVWKVEMSACSLVEVTWIMMLGQSLLRKHFLHLFAGEILVFFLSQRMAE